MVRVRGSRRAAALQPGDYDHEIILVDDDDDDEGEAEAEGSTGNGNGNGNQQPRDTSIEGPGVRAITTFSPLDRNTINGAAGGSGDKNQGDGDGECEGEGDGDGDGEGDDGEAEPRDEELQQHAERSRGRTRLECGHIVRSEHSSPGSQRQSTSPLRPANPIPPLSTTSKQDDSDPAYHVAPRRRRARKRETAVDILYENERGGFLCGVALFSGAALGGLDPRPWTNGYHKASPTDIHTAQCPDPTWQWVWPEWRIYSTEGTGDDGWEYSFHFSKRFSWHRPKWYNSFVRRRAWIRRRAKRRPEDIPADYNMCNDEYFTVVATHDRDQACSVTSSHPSWSTFMHGGTAEGEDERPIIEDIDMLMHILRHCRIDREKREAVENYLEHAIDLAALQTEMHEIMSLFVFQASRRQLLSHFMKKYEETVEDLAREESLELRLHKDALGAAIKHAEEEIRKLAYWSDVKKMAENGEFMAPGESCNAWQGLDESSPCPPCVPPERSPETSPEGSSEGSKRAGKMPQRNGAS